MSRLRYSVLFALSVVLLTSGALFVFSHIGVGAVAVAPTPPAPALEDTTPADAPHLIAPRQSDYARFATEDRLWRERHARALTLDELRARGDGRPTARQLMEDRVFLNAKAGRRGAAISELERWVKAHPKDRDALLSLARLLNEDGRPNDALVRYRQILALGDDR